MWKGENKEHRWERERERERETRCKIRCLAGDIYCSANNLFKYRKSRYSHQQVQGLNCLLRLKAKSVKSSQQIYFLRQCLDLYVTPTHVKTRLRRSKPKNPSAIERAYIRDEIARETDFSRFSREQFAQEWADRTRCLSLFDRLRFRIHQQDNFQAKGAD